MNIQERKNKNGEITSYRIRVFDHRDASTGKQVFKTFSVKYDTSKSAAWNKKNAEKQGAIFEKEVEQQTVTDARITFDNYTDYFLKIKSQSGIASSTAYTYGNFKKRLASYIGHYNLKDLVPTTLNKAYTQMLSDGLTKKYVRTLHGFIHNVLQNAFKEGIIPRNYADAAMPPKAEKYVVTAISEDDLNRFFTALYADESHYMYQVFFSVLLATGCRIGELCALSWNNIDFDEGRIHICRHYVHDKSGWHITDGCKTVAGERWLYMDAEIMDMLREYRAYYLKTAKEYGSKWNVFANAVFFSRIENPGNFLRPKNARVWFDAFLKRNGLPKYHPHQFRHTAISLQLQAGISIPDAAKRAGHNRPDFTLSCYAHTLKNNDRHCSEAVTKVLPKLPKHAAG